MIESWIDFDKKSWREETPCTFSRIWRDTIEMDRLKMEWRSQTRCVCGWGYEGVTWRVFAKTIMNLRRLWKKEHLLSILATVTQYCAGDKIEKNEMGWACGAYGWGEGVYRVLLGKPEGRRPLGRPRRRWVDNIRMDLQEMGCGYVDWIGLAQDRDRWRTLVSAVMNVRVPWNEGNFLTSCKPVSFSRRTLHHGVSK